MNALPPLLVTGGRGYLGRVVLRQALAAGHDVVSYDREWSDQVPSGVVAGFGELTDTTRLAGLIESTGVGAIIHTAGFAHPELSLLAPMTVVAANVVGTVAVLEAARLAGVTTIVNLSTHRVYGDHDGATCEAAPLRPQSPYAATKVAAEVLVESYARDFGLDTTSLRVAEIYGPGLAIPTPLSELVTAVAHGTPVRWPGGGDQTMELIHVEDAARAALLAASARSTPRGAYNITGPRQVTLADCAAELCALRPDAAIDVGCGPMPGYDQRGPLTRDAAHHDLGFTAQISLADGLAGWLTSSLNAGR